MWHVHDVGGPQSSPAPQPPAPSETPQEVLERRLASGEYERLRSVLEPEPSETAPHPR